MIVQGLPIELASLWYAKYKKTCDDILYGLIKNCNLYFYLFFMLDSPKNKYNCTV